MAEGGYCCFPGCGRETEYHVSSDGVLCSKHYPDYKEDFDEVQKWYREEEERIGDKLKEIDYEIGDKSGGYHHKSDGMYRIECNRCGGSFRSDDSYDSGLCPSCTEKVSRLRDKREKIWKDFKDLHVEKMNRVQRRYGLKEIGVRYDVW